MFKKFLSLLLAVMMVVSVMAVGVVTSSAATTAGFTPDPNKIYFDTDGTGWDMSQTKYKIAFYFAGGDFDTEANPTKPIAWGGSKLIGTATEGQSGVFEFDPVEKLGYQLTPGVQYKLIFARIEGKNWKEQTYDLFFTTDCLGHVAKCDGTMIENPVDSSKKALPAYWDDAIDPTENGPVKAITSIGNVVGSCLEQGKTDVTLLEEFFTEEKKDFQNKTSYQNAHGCVCEISETSPNYKSEQKLIDDIGAGLGLTKDDVKAVLEEDAVVAKLEELGCSWSYDDSTLPAGQAPHTHTPGEPVIENEVPATCKAEGSYDEVVYCTECGDEISRTPKTIDKLAHTPGEAVKENEVPATCKAEGSYDEVVYCTECGDVISRTPKTIDKLAHTPGEAVKENEVPATCKAEGSYDEVVYCTECGDEISRTPKTIDKLDHTPGDPVQDMMAGYPATCTEDGLKVMVTRCTECGEELDRQNVTIKAEGHKLHFVDEVPATATKDGVKAHYACENCDKLFADADGTQEVTAESLVIPAQFVRGDVNNDGFFDGNDVTTLQRVLVELDVPVYNEVVADVTGDGVIDARDVTLMQRVIVKMTTWEAWDAKHQPT